MTTLLVPTSEGVDLRHEVAGAGSRFTAGLLDLMLLAIGYLVVVLSLLVPLSFDPTGVSRFLFGVLVGGGLLVVLLYHAAFHAWRAGQTPGKRALGIRVLSADGLPASGMQVLLRSLLWPIDVILPVPAPLGLIVIASTSKHQRLGDLFAGTLVVRVPGRTRRIEPFEGRLWSTLPERRLALTPGSAARLGPEDRAFLRDLILRGALSDAKQRDLFVATALHYSERLGLGSFEDARTFVYELYLFAREHAAA